MFLVNLVKTLKNQMISKVIAITVLAALAGYFSGRFFGDDNPVEQLAEKIIEKETGVHVDLSEPSSKTH